MEIANSFQELGAQTAEWFGLGFNACINNKFINQNPPTPTIPNS